MIFLLVRPKGIFYFIISIQVWKQLFLHFHEKGDFHHMKHPQKAIKHKALSVETHIAVLVELTADSTYQQCI